MDAYNQGFVKACQDRGVDPQALIKAAGAGAMISRGFNRAKQGVRRAGELITGSRVKRIEASTPKPGHDYDTVKALMNEKSKRSELKQTAKAVGAGAGIAGLSTAIVRAPYATKKDK